MTGSLSTWAATLGIVGILMSILTIIMVNGISRKNRLFQKHIISSRRHLMNAVEAVRLDDAVTAELQLAASEEELERAEHYL